MYAVKSRTRMPYRGPAAPFTRFRSDLPICDQYTANCALVIGSRVRVTVHIRLTDCDRLPTGASIDVQFCVHGSASRSEGAKCP